VSENREMNRRRVEEKKLLRKSFNGRDDFGIELKEFQKRKRLGEILMRKKWK
jgi:hypothetical protein